MDTHIINHTNKRLLVIQGLKAVILNMDAIITLTAKIHKEAWKQTFNEFLKKQDKDYPLMTDEDYFQYLDGKSRQSGTKSFLESRNISLHEGLPNDALDVETIEGLGNKKNALFLQLLHQGGVEIYENAIQQIKEWRYRGIKTAVVSSSKNCKHVLETAGIEKLFDVHIDGVVARKRNLKGKPNPDIFIEATKQLGIKPSSSVVFEDDLAGVKAGRQVGFAYVIGISRTNNETALYENGADKVVKNLSEVDLFNNKQTIPSYTQYLPSAFLWQSKFYKLVSNKQPALFLDYDGTLSPIVKHPEDAVISKEIKEALIQCAIKFTVAIVSGRDMEDVKSKVNIDNILYAGSHGFRISGPDGLYMEHEKSKKRLPELNQIENELHHSLDNIEGLQIERKQYAIAVHYRNVAEKNIPQIKESIINLLKHFDKYKKGEGKKIIEVKPDVDWHKGKAINWIMEKLELLDNPEIIPIYIGDDVTDEDAFKTLSDYGIGILVDSLNKPSAAKYRLENVKEVCLFLQELSTIKK